MGCRMQMCGGVVCRACSAAGPWKSRLFLSSSPPVQMMLWGRACGARCRASCGELVMKVQGVSASWAASTRVKGAASA